MCDPSTPAPNRHDLFHWIQSALEKERRIHPSLYEPSPGQIMGHVDHRVTQVVIRVLEDHGLVDG